MNNNPNPNKRYTNFNNQQQRRGAQNNRGRGRGMRGRGKPRMMRQRGRRGRGRGRGRGVAMTNMNQNNPIQPQQQSSNMTISRTIQNDTATTPPNMASIQSNESNLETSEQRLERLRRAVLESSKQNKSMTNPMISGVMTQTQIENEQRKKLLAARTQRRQTLKKQPLIQQQQTQNTDDSNVEELRKELRKKALQSMATKNKATMNMNTNTNTNSTQPIPSAAAQNKKRRQLLRQNKQQPPAKRIKLIHRAAAKPPTTATMSTNRNALNPNAAIYQPPVINKGFGNKASIASTKSVINTQIPNQTTPTNSTTDITINNKPSTGSNNIPRRQLKSYRTVPKHKDNISFTTTIFDNNHKVIKTVITTNDNNKKQPVSITNNKNMNKSININPTIPPIPPNLPPIIPTPTLTPFVPVQQKPIKPTPNIKPPAPKPKQPQNLLPLNAANWACQHCTFHNNNNITIKCKMCQRENFIKTPVPTQSSQTNKSIQSIPSISKPIAKLISKPIAKPIASTPSIPKPIHSIKPKQPPKLIQISKPKPMPITKPVPKPKPIATTTIKPVAPKPMPSKPVKIGQSAAPKIASPISSKPKTIFVSKPMTQNEMQRNTLSVTKTAPSLSISKPITTMIKPATTKPIIPKTSPSKLIAIKQSKPMNVSPVKQSVVTDTTTSIDAIWKQRDKAKAIQQSQQQQQSSKQQMMINKAKAMQQRQQQQQQKQKQIQQQQQQKVINTQSISPKSKISPQKRPMMQKSQTVVTASKPNIISISAPMTKNEIQRKALTALKPTIIKCKSEQIINKTDESQPRTPQKMKSNVMIKKSMPSTTPSLSLQDYWKLDVTQKISNKSLDLLVKETDAFIKGMNDDLKLECNSVGIQYIDPFNMENDDILMDIVDDFEWTKKMCKQHNIAWCNDVDMDEFANAVNQCNEY